MQYYIIQCYGGNLSESPILTIYFDSGLKVVTNLY